MKTYDIQPVASTLSTLERHRDHLAARLERLANETDPWCCEGLRYVEWQSCSVARGELIELIITKLDAVNREICAIIAPESQTPAAEIERAVMGAIR